MALTEILVQEADITYNVTQKLIKKCAGHDLSWKPQTGSNWMTLGQVIMHCTNGCGAGIKAFLIDDWGLPKGMKIEDLPPEEMLPPAEKMPSIESVEQALELLAKDRDTATALLEPAIEGRLLKERRIAPWGGPEMTLFQHLMAMIEHLRQHKGQLFYYLKLMGQNVKTEDLWGM
jgi:uncharacterized damage-inducible protein DinB